MKKLIFIILLLPFAAKSQVMTADTVYAVNTWTDTLSVVHVDTIKYITYRNLATTVFIPKKDTAALAVTKWKLDSTAAALLAFNSSTYATITTANTKLSTNGNGSALTGITQSQVTNLTADLSAKQTTLVSGTNIKTVNGIALLGSGNVAIPGAPTFINLAANFSSVITTPAIVTGWSFPVTNGVTYRIEVIAAYQTAATTTGGILGISLTAATGTVRGSARGTVVNTAAATELVIPIRVTTGAGSTLTTTGVTAANSPHNIGLTITFTCTGSGTFNIVWASEVAASASQLNQNSSLIYQALN